MTDQFIIRDGIYMSPVPVQHRDGEYEEGGIETLRDMQDAIFGIAVGTDFCWGR